ncbi:DUF7144 family membrane protein [Actinorugispora endophytica]|uniref:DUF7144 domain-containing protein n=1 Tax=Actinorugispora endophytica TaxID=1605990 RepID=A0A4R6V313_9ACTN|nr:hypothetical protein [Actinorugispora endophytica]TDQ52907.1 hypothetical protein EV190_10523 [Actinorugispora endophytica]
MNRTQNGWVIFAATMLLMVGAINLIQGVITMFMPTYLLAAEGDVLFFGFTLWGIGLVVWGLLLLATGFSLASRQNWARVLGIVFAAVNAITQLAFIAAYPWWSLAVIAIDLLVIYGLTVGWSSEPEPSYASGRADAQEGLRAPKQGTRGRQESRGEHAL